MFEISRWELRPQRREKAKIREEWTGYAADNGKGKNVPSWQLLLGRMRAANQPEKSGAAVGSRTFPKSPQRPSAFLLPQRFDQ